MSTRVPTNHRAASRRGGARRAASARTEAPPAPAPNAPTDAQAGAPTAAHAAGGGGQDAASASPSQVAVAKVAAAAPPGKPAQPGRVAQLVPSPVPAPPAVASPPSGATPQSEPTLPAASTRRRQARASGPSARSGPPGRTTVGSPVLFAAGILGTVAVIIAAVSVTGEKKSDGSGEQKALTRPAASGSAAAGSAPALPGATERPGWMPGQVYVPRAQTTTALNVTAAGYVGNGPGAEEASAADVQPDGSVVVAGRGQPGGGGRRVAAPLGPGTGTVIRLDPNGRQVRSTTVLGTAVDDLAVDRTGQIVTTGDKGVVVLDPTGTSVRWQAPVKASDGRRVAVAQDGTVAALDKTVVRTFAPDGHAIASWTVRHANAHDIAIDDQHRVTVTGDDRSRPRLRVAYVDATDVSGRALWRAWGQAVPGLTADTRGERVAVGMDGMLYTLGESDSGPSLFSRAAHAPGSPGPVVMTDPFTTPPSSGGGTYTFYARLDPATGRQLAGQWLTTRTSAGAPNTVHGRAIAADRAGNVYVGGVAGAGLPGRELDALAGHQVSPYSGSDPWLLVVSQDLRSRLTWLSLGGHGSVNAIAARYGVTVAGATMTAGGAVAEHAPAGGERAADGVSKSAPDAYLAVWPGLVN